MSKVKDQLPGLGPKRLALLALELEARLDAVEGTRNEPIAIVGLGCRLPGGVRTPAELWALLRDGVDAVSEVPADRWDIDAYYDPDPATPGKMSTRWGGFVSGIDLFDADFFGISPREAAALDPQQRLLLQVSWEALERAGLPQDRLAQIPTGVFVGVGSSDYANLLIRQGDGARMDAFALTGAARNAVAGRISYVFGLHGPSLAVDTACSSSLVAVHLACQSLRAGECALALAGGVNVILSPEITMVTSRARMMAADGRCKTFDAAADGFVRGEGCGVVVLRRLSDALRAGDPVLAVVRGSAVNQDGRSGGFTVPNGAAQEAVVREALARAGLAPAQVGYVEAHGTGTPLGDPVEVHSLGTVLSPGRSTPLALGSIKTNLGHLESAAGVAGLLKAVLMLQYAHIPPHLHLKRLNPEIALDRIPAVIPTRLTPWPGARVAGVSSFGASGTNAHLIVQQAPPPASPAGEDAPAQLLVLSARDPEALRALAQRHREWLADGRRLADVAHTAQMGRTHFSHRLALVARDAAEARERLAGWLHGRSGAAVVQGQSHDGYLETVRPGQAPDAEELQSVASRWVAGAPVRWEELRGHGRRIELPTYPFQEKRHWVDSGPPPAPAATTYEVAWRERERVASRPAPASWVVVDALGDGRVLEEALVARGHRCTLLAPEDALGAGGDADGVVYLAGRTPGDAEPAAAYACARALPLVQSLAARPGARLWLVTRGAAPVGRDDVALDQAPLWGLGRTAFLEHPHLAGGLIDLDPSAPDLAALCDEILGGDGESQVALRAGWRFVARLVRHAPASSAGFALTPDGTYLVTGGRGALGLRLAHWLAKRGARHIVLVGRAAPSPEAMAAQAALEARGVRVSAVQADVTDPAALGRLVEGLPSLRGVFHAAGVLDDGVLLRQTAERFVSVMAPKVAGGWRLHELTRTLPLDHFVLFSSASALLGSPGQANYAAANAWLDALAQHRCAHGLPALSVQWGPWAQSGMAAALEGAAARRVTAQGAALLAPEAALAALESLLAEGRPAQAAVLSVDWPRLARERGKAAPLLAELTPEAAPVPALRQRLAVAPASDRPALVQAEVRRAVAEVLGWDEATPLPAQRGFFDMGLDSLTALELRNRLQALVGEPALPDTLVFDHPTPDKLAAFLTGRLLPDAPAPAPAARPAAAGPIAVIGIGCRFPGGVTGPGSFWRLLRDGREAVTDVPQERWDVDEWYDPDPDALGKMYTRRGGFLEDVDRFDARFFGISAREATCMDPQQRLLLEVGWEALEHAGLAADRLEGTPTGVFVGISTSDYLQVIASRGDPRRMDAYLGTGNALSAAAGRLSYVLGLNGPSLAVDTACSSSLVAVHLACQSLREGQCRQALAGGVNLILAPHGHVHLSRARMLSPDGRCKTFDAQADGYGRGEGCGVVVLKRLEDAEADGDRVLAVIRGSAVNQDGRSAGLTVPNGLAQQAVIRAALVAAGVAPAEIGYVEAHGTGTPLGDPIEVQALAAALGDGRTPDAPLLIGSVKTNFGHLEAAAGIAGLIKVVLALERAEIPPHLHLTRPNPHVRWSELPVSVPTTVASWPRPRRLAGVSSFGFIGTNAHVVLEAAPTPAPATPGPRPTHVLALSAPNETVLGDLAIRLSADLATGGDALADIAHTANVGRARFSHRLVVVADSREEASARLAAAGRGDEAAGVLRGQCDQDRGPRLAFLFTGQGAQYAGMARRLYQTEPTFRDALQRCASLAASHLPRPLLDAIADGDGLDQTALAQPALFAISWALAKLWRSWGVLPAAVLGHSVGELAAACVAEAAPFEDAFRFVIERGRLMQSLPPGGAMAAVLAPEAVVAEAVASRAATLAIAAVNGPTNVVVSGARERLAELQVEMVRRGVRIVPLAVSHAFHSPLMDPILEDLERAAARVPFTAPRVPIVVNRTGRVAGATDLVEPAYWRRHAREPVRFADGVGALEQLGVDAYLEIGPQPTLIGLVRGARPDTRARLLASLRLGRDDWRQILESLAGLFAAGAPVDWEGFDRHQGCLRVSLPTYPFQRERFWFESEPRAAAHPLLGRAARVSPAETHFQARVDVSALPLLGDHRVYGAAILSGPTQLSMVFDAAEQRLGGGAHRASRVGFLQPDVLPEAGERALDLVLRGDGEGRARFQVRSADGQGSTAVHSEGQVERDAAPAASVDLAALRARFAAATELDGETFYRNVQAVGFTFGPTFQWIEHLWYGEGESLGRMRVGRDDDGWSGYRFHPGLADSCFQVMAAATGFDPVVAERGDAYVPASIETIGLRGRARGRLWCHARLEPAADAREDYRGSFRLIDDDGAVVAQADGLRLRRAPREVLLRAARRPLDQWLHDLVWEPAGGGTPVPIGGRWLVCADRGGLGQTVANELTARGAEVTLAAEGEEMERAAAAGGLRGVVFLWGLDASADVPARGVGGALGLLQALGNAEAGTRVWLVTRGAQAVGAEDVDAGQATLWGLGRVAAWEFPRLRVSLLDLDPSAVDAPAALLEELALSGEPQIARRAAARYGPRLAVRGASAAPVPLIVHGDGSYLVTGGTGSLGLQVARWLVERGARRVVLASRGGGDAAAQEAIAALRSTGAAIDVVRADVASSAEAELLVAGCAPPLRGVIHAAGVLDDGLLETQTWDRVERVLAPKFGAAHLHRATAALPLDFFVLFSSAAALLGTPGQGAYAAGNAFLDGLAHARRAAGLPALSVNWGPWAEAGMAERLGAAQRDRLAAVMTPLEPADALAALERLLGEGATHAAVVVADWTRMAERLPAGARWPLLDRLAVRREAEGDAPLRRRLQVAPTQRRQHLVDALGEEAARVLGQSDPVDPQQRLFEVGLDSLMAVELKTRLEAGLGLTLPATLLFDHPTIDALADALLEKMGAEAAAAPVPAVVVPRDADEPIAIIGMSCRFPGGADDPEAFWAMLRDGRCGVVEVPPERWDVDAYYDPDPDAPGKTYLRTGGFLADVARFDAPFFRITPREAVSMDPQQRLLLEVSWEAFERAGLSPARLSGTRTGVFVGVMNNDYSRVLMAAGDAARLDGHTGSGNGLDFLAGRVSYVLGLQGPSMVLATACSSSLVAVHLACQSLRDGEADMALAGGVNLMLTPDTCMLMSKMRALAVDGRCKTFDSAADGYGRGEGCGMVVLKRLSAAQGDGDPVLAVIRASATNHNGPASGLTVPHGPSQEALLRGAWARAGVRPDEVGYVEAHGTGTPLGDPIELRALSAVLGTRAQPCWVGSVKTNIGHLESAAGVAGLMKVVLALQHGAIPPHLHLREPNPRFPWAEAPVAVPTKLVPWPAGQRKVAAVSAFGLSGVNAHVVLEASPPVVPPAAAPAGPRAIALSARTPEALDALAALFAGRLAAGEDVDDVVRTAGAGRTAFEHRLALVGDDAEDLRRRLATGDGGRRGRAGRPRVAFLFSGQGGQYSGMGHGLYDSEPVYRQAIDRCGERLRPLLGGRSLVGLLHEEGAPLDETGFTQPALFALQWALTQLWRSWGVEPRAVLGHSIGELAAACAAGCLTVEEGLDLVAARGRLMQALPERGAMAAVFADEARVSASLGGRLAIAAINGPQEVVVSGPAEEVAALRARLAAEGIRAQALNVSHAFHSPLMDPMLDEFEATARRLSAAPPQTAFVSSLTGALLEGAPDARYWRRQVREPVRFAEAVSALAEAADQVVEIGPNPTLLALARRVALERPVDWLPSLRRGHDDGRQIRDSAGALYVAGVDLDWERLGGERGRRVALPTYPFQRERYWVDPPAAPRRAVAPVPGPEHALLGRRVRTPLRQAVYEARLGPDTPVGEHRLHGAVVVPAAWWLSMMLAAADGSPAVEDVTFPEPLIADEERTVQLVCVEDGGIEAYALDEGDSWRLHARGRRGALRAPAVTLPGAEQFGAEPVEAEPFYQMLAERGISLGPRFRRLERVWRRDGAALARLRTLDWMGGVIDPGLLDAGFQLLAATLTPAEVGGNGEVQIPFSAERVRLHQPVGPPRWAHARRRSAAGAPLTGDVYLFEDAGGLVLEVEGLTARPAGAELMAHARRRHAQAWLHQIVWQPGDRAADAGEASGRWLLLADDDAWGEAVTTRLRARGAECAVVYPGGRFERVSADAWRVEPDDPAQIARVLDEAGPPWRGIVHAWGLSPSLPRDTAAEDLLAAQRLLSRSALHLAQAVAAASPRARGPVWWITRGAEGGTLHGLAQAPLVGLALAAATEQPSLRGALVDLDVEPGPQEAEALVRELMRGPTAERVRLRGEERLLARLERSAPPAAAALSAEGSWLLTGGLGGVGLRLARRLVARGARHLLLMGRRPPRGDAEAVLAELARSGARVDVVQGDVSAFADVERAVAAAPDLRGVFHLAGVLDDAVLANQSAERLHRALAPKMAGAWNLHRATAARPLEQFVMFSSAASVLGAPGQANYAAANAFLDALAAYRRGLALPACTVNWGPWAEVGMAAGLAEREGRRWTAVGMGMVDAEMGLDLLEWILAARLIQAAVIPADWPRLVARLGGGPPPLLATVAAAGAARPDGEVRALRERLLGSSLDEGRRLLTSHLQLQLQRVLGLPAGTLVEPDQGLFELGLDSLLALELKQHLDGLAGHALPATIVFECPTVGALADHLARHELRLPADAPAVEAAPEGDPQEAGALSEEQLYSILAEELSRLQRDGG